MNPTSMVGWRLSANGSLIPPHDLLTGNLPNAATQKRGSERLFQYLEAEGSDPEDYARYLLSFPLVVCSFLLFMCFSLCSILNFTFVFPFPYLCCQISFVLFIMCLIFSSFRFFSYAVAKFQYLF